MVFVEYSKDSILKLPQIVYDGYPSVLGKVIDSLQDPTAVIATVVNTVATACNFDRSEFDPHPVTFIHEEINKFLDEWATHTDSQYVYVYMRGMWSVAKVNAERKLRFYPLKSFLEGNFSEFIDDWMEPIQREEVQPAPTITYESIKKKIRNAQYWESPSGKATVCEITLENGFTVRGESAVVCKENFKKDVGRKIAYDNAVDKIWMLEGYLLQEKLYQASKKIKEDD